MGIELERAGHGLGEPLEVRDRPGGLGLVDGSDLPCDGECEQLARHVLGVEGLRGCHRHSDVAPVRCRGRRATCRRGPSSCGSRSRGSTRRAPSPCPRCGSCPSSFPTATRRSRECPTYPLAGDAPRAPWRGSASPGTPASPAAARNRRSEPRPRRRRRPCPGPSDRSCGRAPSGGSRAARGGARRPRGGSAPSRRPSRSCRGASSGRFPRTRRSPSGRSGDAAPRSMSRVVISATPCRDAGTSPSASPSTVRSCTPSSPARRWNTSPKSRRSPSPFT